MSPEKTERSLYALSKQEGNPGVIQIKTVMLLLQLRDERIQDLSEYQRAVISDERRKRLQGATR